MINVIFFQLDKLMSTYKKRIIKVYVCINNQIDKIYIFNIYGLWVYDVDYSQ